MRRLVPIILLLLCCAFGLKAQDYKVLSVESLPLDMSAREEIRTDEDGRQCALFRISTQEIASAFKEGFYFGSDYGAYVVERFIVDGEIWLWVSPGLKTLKIKHTKLGQCEVYMPNYGIKVESLNTYRIVIQGRGEALVTEGASTQQFIVFNVTPPDAVVTVNGVPWPLVDGFAQKKVEFGKYEYCIEAPNYQLECGTVEVNDPEKMAFVKKELKPEKGSNQANNETAPKKKERQPVKTLNFLTLNYAYTIAPQSSFGFTYGRAGRFGWFISLMSNGGFRANSAAGTCWSNDSEVPDGWVFDDSFEDGGWLPYYNGEYITDRNSLIVGGIARLAKPVYLKLGVGYGFRNLYWLTEDDTYYLNAQHSYNGVETLAGLQLDLGGFVLSLETVTTDFKYLEGKLGLGYAF